MPTPISRRLPLQDTVYRYWIPNRAVVTHVVGKVKPRAPSFVNDGNRKVHIQVTEIDGVERTSTKTSKPWRSNSDLCRSGSSIQQNKSQYGSNSKKSRH